MTHHARAHLPDVDGSLAELAYALDRWPGRGILPAVSPSMIEYPFDSTRATIGGGNARSLLKLPSTFFGETRS